MVCDEDTIKEIGGVTLSEIIENNNKSILEIGNLKIYNTKKFNCLNRLMFRLFFGIKITNIK